MKSGMDIAIWKWVKLRLCDIALKTENRDAVSQLGSLYFRNNIDTECSKITKNPPSRWQESTCSSWTISPWSLIKVVFTTLNIYSTTSAISPSLNYYSLRIFWPRILIQTKLLHYGSMREQGILQYVLRGTKNHENLTKDPLPRSDRAQRWLNMIATM